jgi:CubicO group peptidase (beta-lactamase class C family)
MRDTIPLVLSRVLWLTVALATRGGAQARPPVRGGAPAPGIGERITNGLRPLVHVTNGRDTTYALTDRMRNYHVAGVSIAVMDGGRVGWAQGFGVAEVGGTERVDTATLFQAGSISKPIFATAVLALVEQGRLVLDSDVTGQLRSWRLPPSAFTATEKVALRASRCTGSRDTPPAHPSRASPKCSTGCRRPTAPRCAPTPSLEPDGRTRAVATRSHNS